MQFFLFSELSGLSFDGKAMAHPPKEKSFMTPVKFCSFTDKLHENLLLIRR